MLQDARRPAVGLLRRALRAASLPFAWPAAALRRSRAATSTRAQSAECAKFDHRRWTASLLKHLEWRRFEETCAAYFQALGFTTRVARSPSASGGVDIGLCAAGSERVTTLVHCKAWDAYRVGVKPLRELREAMRAADAREGIFITSGLFTREAAAFAAAESISLVDGAALLGKLAELPPKAALELLELTTRGDFLTPTCPVCAIKMVSRKSIQGGRSFWGCSNYPACKETLSATAPVWG
jgi:restriction system protein